MQAVAEGLEGAGGAPVDAPTSRTKDRRNGAVAALLWTTRLAAEIAAHSVAYLVVVIVCFGAVHLVGLL